MNFYHIYRLVENSGCDVSRGTVRITDVDSADGEVIFTAATEVLLAALQLEPLGLRVS